VPDLGYGQGGEECAFHFCDCLMCAQADKRLGIAVNEKDVHVSVRTNSTDALSQFV
jgi:hypothetical protein